MKNIFTIQIMTLPLSPVKRQEGTQQGHVNVAHPTPASRPPSPRPERGAGGKRATLKKDVDMTLGDTAV
jgi:hypothetical protein